VVNAYLQPRVTRYLEALARACGPRLQIVLSHGGGAPAREAAKQPVRQLLSGPAAGLWAAFRAGKGAGFRSLLTLDVGGTSTDVAFAERGLPRSRAREVAGFPILLPLLDVHTVGAGGGSIAAVDAGGLLAVGPESAGADPGPACYGRGGPTTVTDALVVLGRLPAMALGGGEIVLDAARAHAALARLAPRLKLAGAARAAEAVVTVANARMETALRRVSVERGHDPRGAALVAFGGAGGLHACELAEALGVPAVVFPAHAGMLSALGAVASPETYQRSRTVLRPASDAPAIDREVERLTRAVDRSFTRSGTRVASRQVLARYRGQSHELELPSGHGLERRFHEAHRERYGFAREGAAVEVVTVQVEGWMSWDDLPAPHAARARQAPRPESRATAWVNGRRRAIPVWRFEALAAGAALVGPAIVLQSGATLWLAPGWRARLHPGGALVAERRARR
jgi:N-methylhydantoinase A/oxoprolinase/acetone carboxylase beta subunit